MSPSRPPDPTTARTSREVVPGKNAYDDAAMRERKSWLRARTGVSLDALDTRALEAETLEGNVENFVGAVSVPIGLAGPLELHGEHVRGSVVAPFATTEGALVAATTRGARAINLAGGVHVKVHSRQMLRAPLFGFANGEHAARFAAWVPAELDALRRVVGASSRFAELLELRPYVLGRDVHLLLSYRTGDAAGQNMTTICTAACCEHLSSAWTRNGGAPVEMCLVEGQMSGDKNLSFLGMLHGRGARVSAECRLPREVLTRVLKVAPETLARAHHAGTSGALQAGVIGYNANVANVLAAVFVATGQDIACVHESALGILTLDTSDDALYASLVLPALVVGTVGGGTGLPAQATCLDLLGCRGPGTVLRLCEIICGFALALELSSYAAMVAGHFAGAHARLGRKSSAG
jgi:hydroxymethylglutaryl-CoA reductase (NADPH)